MSDRLDSGLNVCQTFPFKLVTDALWIKENLYVATLTRWDDVSGSRLDPPKITHLKNGKIQQEYETTEEVDRLVLCGRKRSIFVGITKHDLRVFDEKLTLLSSNQHGGVCSIAAWDNIGDTLLTVRGKTLILWRFRFGQYSFLFDHQIDIESDGVIDLATNINHECVLLYDDKAAIINLDNKK